MVVGSGGAKMMHVRPITALRAQGTSHWVHYQAQLRPGTLYVAQETIDTLPPIHLICSAVLVQLFAYQVEETGIGSSFVGRIHLWTLLQLVVEDQNAYRQRLRQIGMDRRESGTGAGATALISML